MHAPPARPLNQPPPFPRQKAGAQARALNSVTTGALGASGVSSTVPSTSTSCAARWGARMAARSRGRCPTAAPLAAHETRTAFLSWRLSRSTSATTVCGASGNAGRVAAGRDPLPPPRSRSTDGAARQPNRPDRRRAPPGPRAQTKLTTHLARAAGLQVVKCPAHDAARERIHVIRVWFKATRGASYSGLCPRAGPTCGGLGSGHRHRFSAAAGIRIPGPPALFRCAGKLRDAPLCPAPFLGRAQQAFVCGRGGTRRAGRRRRRSSCRQPAPAPCPTTGR